MSSNAVIPFLGPQTEAGACQHSAPPKSKKRAPRKRRNRKRPMESSPIRSLVHTPVPSIIYPEVYSAVPSPFDTPPDSLRHDSPEPDSGANLEEHVEIRAAELSDDVGGEFQTIRDDAPVYQGDPLDVPSSESTRTHTPSVRSTSSSSSSSRHSNNNSHNDPTNQSFTSARSHETRSRVCRRARPHRRRSTSSPNGWYRLTRMEKARKKGQPVKYGVTRDLRVAFMRESGTVKIGKRPVFGCCVIQ